jgi:hypothetical protein
MVATRAGLKTAEEAWAFLIREGGLDVQGYDEDLLTALATTLAASAPHWDGSKPFSANLKSGGLTIEQFVYSFFSAVEPYARMLADIYGFFETHGVKTAEDKALRLQFDFGAKKGELEFDIESFREMSRAWDKVVTKAFVTLWDDDALWRLESYFQEHRTPWGEYEDVQATLGPFIDAWNRGAWPPLPPMPKAGSDAADAAIEKMWGVLERVLDQCRAAAADQRSLRERVGKAQNHPDDASDGLRDVVTLARVCGDHWPRTFAVSIHRWASQLRAVGSQERVVAAAPKVAAVDTLFASRPKAHRSVRVFRRILEDILALPMWKRRHELYACWVLAQLNRALSHHDIALHANDGVLRLGFRATHIATAQSTAGPLYVMSEVRTPAIGTPKGKGRRRNVQPDFRVMRGSSGKASGRGGAPDETLLALEVKQYGRASKSNFVNAMNDYAAACPGAAVMLVNYGDAAASFLGDVEPRHRPRVNLIGGFRPYTQAEESTELGKKRDFETCVLRALPLPTAKGVTAALNGLSSMRSDGVLAVDVSGSMQASLGCEAFQSALQSALNAGRFCRIVAVSDREIASWTTEEFRWDELSRVAGGTTDIQSALKRYQWRLHDVLLFTDDEGAEQVAQGGWVLLGIVKAPDFDIVVRGSAGT